MALHAPRLIPEPEPAIDAARLPRLAWGHATPIWWGVWGLMLIEGTVFALLIMVYLYLWRLAGSWPPDGVPLPGLTASTLNTAVLLASVPPTVGMHRMALRQNRRETGWWLTVATLLTLASVALRGMEFAHANVRWDTNAYGSVVWMILGTHASHLIASALEDLLFCALVFFGSMEDKHFVTITASAIYGYFIAGAWLPLYVLLYWLPRL
jgi:cytochrome c oxidase subunit III